MSRLERGPTYGTKIRSTASSSPALSHVNARAWYALVVVREGYVYHDMLGSGAMV